MTLVSARIAAEIEPARVPEWSEVERQEQRDKLVPKPTGWTARRFMEVRNDPRADDGTRAIALQFAVWRNQQARILERNRGRLASVLYAAAWVLGQQDAGESTPEVDSLGARLGLVMRRFGYRGEVPRDPLSRRRAVSEYRGPR